MKGELNFNRRSKDRVQVNLQCMYFIKGKSARFETCRISDMSRSGARLDIAGANAQTFSAGDIVLLEMLKPGAFSSVNLKARIVRILPGQGECGLGVKFDPPMDQKTFLDLT